MFHIREFFKSEVQARFLLRSLLLDHRFHFHLGALRGIAYDCSFGASDQVLCKRVAMLAERKGYYNLIILNVNVFHHSELHHVLVAFGWVLDLEQPFVYFVRFHNQKSISQYPFRQ